MRKFFFLNHLTHPGCSPGCTPASRQRLSAEDLIFRSAKPVIGGLAAAAGQHHRQDHRATTTDGRTNNNFQGRYIIRPQLGVRRTGDG
jgi:hypothetical protein